MNSDRPEKNNAQAHRLENEADGKRAAPGYDPERHPKGTPQRVDNVAGGLGPQGEGTPLKSDKEEKETHYASSKGSDPKLNTGAPSGEGEWSGRDSQRGMGQMGIDSQGRNYTANEMSADDENT